MGKTGIIVKVIHNVADKFCLRPIVLKLDDEHDWIFARAHFRVCAFFLSVKPVSMLGCLISPKNNERM